MGSLGYMYPVSGDGRYEELQRRLDVIEKRLDEHSAAPRSGSVVENIAREVDKKAAERAASEIMRLMKEILANMNEEVPISSKESKNAATLPDINDVADAIKKVT